MNFFDQSQSEKSEKNTPFFQIGKQRSNYAVFGQTDQQPASNFFDDGPNTDKLNSSDDFDDIFRTQDPITFGENRDREDTPFVQFQDKSMSKKTFSFRGSFNGYNDNEDLQSIDENIELINRKNIRVPQFDPKENQEFQAHISDIPVIQKRDQKQKEISKEIKVEHQRDQPKVKKSEEKMEIEFPKTENMVRNPVKEAPKEFLIKKEKKNEPFQWTNDSLMRKQESLFKKQEPLLKRQVQKQISKHQSNKMQEFIHNVIEKDSSLQSFEEKPQPKQQSLRMNLNLAKSRIQQKKNDLGKERAQQRPFDLGKSRIQEKKVDLRSSRAQQSNFDLRNSRVQQSNFDVRNSRAQQSKFQIKQNKNEFQIKPIKSQQNKTNLRNSLVSHYQGLTSSIQSRPIQPFNFSRPQQKTHQNLHISMAAGPKQEKPLRLNPEISAFGQFKVPTVKAQPKNTLQQSVASFKTPIQEPTVASKKNPYAIGKFQFKSSLPKQSESHFNLSKQLSQPSSDSTNHHSDSMEKSLAVKDQLKKSGEVVAPPRQKVKSIAPSLFNLNPPAPSNNNKNVHFSSENLESRDYQRNQSYGASNQFQRDNPKRGKESVNQRTISQMVFDDDESSLSSKQRSLIVPSITSKESKSNEQPNQNFLNSKVDVSKPALQNQAQPLNNKKPTNFFLGNLNLAKPQKTQPIFSQPVQQNKSNKKGPSDFVRHMTQLAELQREFHRIKQDSTKIKSAYSELSIYDRNLNKMAEDALKLARQPTQRYD